MKHTKKSATFALRALFFLSLCFLCSCADVPVPTWLTGEPGKDVLSAPRVVSVPTNAGDRAWPNLADVPETKPVFTSEPIRSGRAEDMNSERLKALVEMERLRNIQLYGRDNVDTGMSQLPSSFSVPHPNDEK